MYQYVTYYLLNMYKNAISFKQNKFDVNSCTKTIFMKF